MSDLGNANLIRNGRLLVNTWRLFESNASNTAVFPPDEGNWMVTLGLWRKMHAERELRTHQVAVIIHTDANHAELFVGDQNLLDDQRIALLAIDFPVYTDGRGFSLAQILRNQCGWNGELRAVGDVMIDTVYYLSRCGFDSFLIKEGHDPQQALKALNSFTGHYQQAYAQRNPAISHE